MATATPAAVSGKINLHLAGKVDIAGWVARAAGSVERILLEFSGAARRFRPRAHLSNSAREAKTEPMRS
jgi:hypothetical protein